MIQPYTGLSLVPGTQKVLGMVGRVTVRVMLMVEVVI